MRAPLWFDYGCNTYFSKNCSTNFTCPVYISDNVLFGLNVTLAAPMHPLLPEERNVHVREDKSRYILEYAKPITIESNCRIAANVVIYGGVTIGEGSVIGAGNVVTRDIPLHSLADGNPCRVSVRKNENDKLPSA